MKNLSRQRKIVLVLVVILVFVGGLALWRIFSPPAEEGVPEEFAYEVMTLMPQEPLTVSGQTRLITDQSYFYDPTLGEIDEVYIGDGQEVHRGDLLFRYYQGGEVEQELLGSQREQTRLYNQRVALVDSLRQATGQAYNNNGDLLGGYWGQDGQYYYYIAESIDVIHGPDLSAGSEDGEGGAFDTESIRSQIRELNQQIAEVESRIQTLNGKLYVEVRAKSPGQVILNPSGRTDASVPLVRLVSDSVQIAGSVSEYEFYLLQEGLPVDLYVKAEDRTLPGEIVAYDDLPPAQAVGSDDDEGMGQMDFGQTSPSPASFAFLVQPSDYIRPGFSVDILLRAPGFVIPEEAILEEADGTYVFVYRQGQVEKVPVQLEAQGLQQVVHRGLEEGDQIVLYPFDLQDGQTINVMDGGLGLEEEFEMEEGMVD